MGATPHEVSRIQEFPHASIPVPIPALTPDNQLYTMLLAGHFRVRKKKKMRNYKLSSTHIAVEKFDDEAVILDLRSGKYFSLSQSATLVLEEVLNGVAVENLIEYFLDVDFATQDDVDSFIELTLSHDLIVRFDGVAETFPSDEFAAKLRTCAEPLKMDVYDDLADLVLADPIHEVEEQAGWPIRKANA